LNTCTTIEQRGVVRFLWAKNMDAAKDIHREMLPIWAEMLLSSGDSFPHLIQKRRLQLGFVTYLLNCPRIIVFCIPDILIKLSYSSAIYFKKLR
jgi:hypothetical protein